MVEMDNIILVTVFVLASFIQVNALHCWTCSSESDGYKEACGKKLSPNKLAENIAKTGHIIQNCSALKWDHYHKTDEFQNLIHVCRRQTLKKGTEIIYLRNCDFVDKKANRTACKHLKSHKPEEEIIECEDCTTDYCNRSIGIIPSLLTFIFPILLAKFLLY